MNIARISLFVVGLFVIGMAGTALPLADETGADHLALTQDAVASDCVVWHEGLTIETETGTITTGEICVGPP